MVAETTMPAGAEATVAEEAVRTPATCRQQVLATPAVAPVVVASTGSRETTKARIWAYKWATW